MNLEKNYDKCLVGISTFNVKALKPIALISPSNKKVYEGLDVKRNGIRFKWHSVEEISSSRLVISRDKAGKIIVYKKNNPNSESHFVIPNPETNRDVDWGYRHFRNHIINACSAIFLHNLGRRFYYKNKMNAQQHRLLFLLKLADELQDWDRPGNSTRKIYSAKDFSIKVRGQRIDLVVPKGQLKHFKKIRKFFSGIKIKLPGDR